MRIYAHNYLKLINSCKLIFDKRAFIFVPESVKMTFITTVQRAVWDVGGCNSKLRQVLVVAE